MTSRRWRGLLATLALLAGIIVATAAPAAAETVPTFTLYTGGSYYHPGRDGSWTWTIRKGSTVVGTVKLEWLAGTKKEIVVCDTWADNVGPYFHSYVNGTSATYGTEGYNTCSRYYVYYTSGIWNVQWGGYSTAYLQYPH
jgi:hypothetical protein